MSPVCYDSLSGNAVTSGIKEMVNSALENKNFSYNDIPSDISVLCVRLRELSDYVGPLSAAMNKFRHRHRCNRS